MPSKREKIVFFYIIPILNVFFYVNTNLLQIYFPADIIYAGILTLLSVYFFLFIYKKNNISSIRIIFYFSILTLIMGIYTYIKHSYFDVKTLKIILSNFFFVFGFFIIKSERDYLAMLKGSFFAFCFFIINIVLYNYFGLGSSSAYNVDVDFRFGGQGINTVQLLPFFILSSTFLLTRKEYNYFYKSIVILIILFSLFILVFSTKRGSLLAVVFGFGYYFYKNKINLKGGLVLMLLLMGLFFLINQYSDQIESVYEKRETRINALTEKEGLETEGRFTEFLMIVDQIEKNPLSLLVGNGIGSEYFIPGNERMIHADFNVVFYSMGILGFAIFILFFIKIIKYLFWFKKYSTYEMKDNLITLAIMMILNLFFVGLSGSVHAIQNRSFSLFVIGGVLSLLNSQTVYSSNLKS